MSNLDNRLKLCADFVRPGATLADIGTDHAYLPVWLCQNGICPSAIAADINPEPLKSGMLTIQKAGLADKIETRLSDGLAAIREAEADDIVIAGMGGELIADIIATCPFSENPEKRWILQPMTKSEMLLLRLNRSGFEILRQDCCVAAGKCYTVLQAAYTGNTTEKGALFPYLGKLTPWNNATHLRFVNGHIDRLLKQANGDARFAVLANELKEACHDDRS